MLAQYHVRWGAKCFIIVEPKNVVQQYQKVKPRPNRIKD